MSPRPRTSFSRVVNSSSVIGIAVDLETLLDAAQVRRGEQAGAVAGAAVDGGQHRRGRTLALGAGDVDDAQAAVRIAQSAQQTAHAVELEVVGGRGARARS